MAPSTTIRKPNRMSHVAVFRRKMSVGAERLAPTEAAAKTEYGRLRDVRRTQQSTFIFKGYHTSRLNSSYQTILLK